jgi:hypothetical protein
MDALGSEPRGPDAVLEATEDVVPEWERRRSDTWREEWLDRTERLLEWATLLGFADRTDEADRTDGEYVHSPSD